MDHKYFLCFFHLTACLAFYLLWILFAFRIGSQRKNLKYERNSKCQPNNTFVATVGYEVFSLKFSRFFIRVRRNFFGKTESRKNKVVTEEISTKIWSEKAFNDKSFIVGNVLIPFRKLNVLQPSGKAKKPFFWSLTHLKSQRKRIHSGDSSPEAKMSFNREWCISKGKDITNIFSLLPRSFLFDCQKQFFIPLNVHEIELGRGDR